MFQTYLKSLLITEFGISFYTEIKIKLIQNSVPQSSGPDMGCSLAARGSGPPRWTMTGGTACHATAQPPSSAPAPPSRLALFRAHSQVAGFLIVLPRSAPFTQTRRGQHGRLEPRASASKMETRLGRSSPLFFQVSANLGSCGNSSRGGNVACPSSAHGRSAWQGHGRFRHRS